LPYNPAENGGQNNGWRITRPDAFADRCNIVKLISMAVLLLIGWLDYITGYELGFFIFYFIPVAISSWYCGRRLGLQIAFGSAIVWYLSDKYTFHPYSHSYLIYWEMFMRLISFLTTTLTISRIRTMVLNEERMLSHLMAMETELESFRNVTGKEQRPAPNPEYQHSDAAPDWAEPTT
jgi:K+-sensing histidine kinase KdpD